MGKRYWECFLEHSDLWKEKSVALYGTGVIAAEILEKCKHIRIAGVYDRALRSGMLCDVRILNIRDIRKDGIEVIVIAAQPENVYAIYKRIANTAIAANVGLYNIYGEDLTALYGEQEYGFEPDDHCFEQDADSLLEWIRSHDVISFDIFDTLVMRKVYEPHDVFYIVQNIADERGIKVDSFYANRIQAEINLIRQIPTLVEIYEEFQRLTKVSAQAKEELSQIEIEIERQVIIPREKMVDIFHKAIDMKKQVYLISDMYLPTALLEDILEQNGITGYIKLYNSCDFHRPKVDGLFEIFVGQVKGKRYLHIGDHAQADGECAKRAGIDSYVIKKGSEICESSVFQDVGLNIRTWNEKLLYGSFVSRLFNDPFCVGTNGRIVVQRVEDLAFCGVAPMVLTSPVLQKAVKNFYDTYCLFGDDSPVSTEFLDGTMSVLEENRICVKDRRVRELSYLSDFRLYNLCILF